MRTAPPKLPDQHIKMFDRGFSTIVFSTPIPLSFGIIISHIKKEKDSKKGWEMFPMSNQNIEVKDTITMCIMLHVSL